MDKSTVRPSTEDNGKGDPKCWRCGRTLTADDQIEDRCVLSSKGLRHLECAS